jgi:hypothetical protein
MAKVVGSFFNMKMSGKLGEVVFDRRGFVRLKGEYHDPRTASQGDFRQTMAAAQKCAKVCGPATRQLVKEISHTSAQWRTYLIKNLIGPNRALYLNASTWGGVALAINLADCSDRPDLF